MNPSSHSHAGSILFRPDLAPEIGTGHLMRCLALAETCLAQGRQALFALHACPAELSARIERPGIRTLPLRNPADVAELGGLARRHRASALVLDGYRFDAGYRAALGQLGLPVLAMDDGNLAFPLHADIVVNSSPLADPDHYARFAPGARLLLGPGYAPLRDEFRGSDAAPASDAPADRVLLTFGGSDPAGLTVPVAEALLDALPQAVCLDIVLGAAAADPQAAQRLADAHPARLRLHRNTTRMAALMRQAALAVSAAGSTLWELARLGVPTIAVVVADNQAGNLLAPASDWFDTLDARTDRQDAVASVAAAVRALWQDGDARAQRRARLRAIGVGENTADICRALAETRASAT